MWCSHRNTVFVLISPITTLGCSASSGSVGPYTGPHSTNAMQYFAFGDSIYVPDTHIRRRHGAAEGHPNKDQLDREDHALNSVRDFVENHFGQLDQLFPYSRFKGQNKIASSMPIKEISFCRVLLRNCHVCLYENQTSKRSDLEPPSLENSSLTINTNY